MTKPLRLAAVAAFVVVDVVLVLAALRSVDDEPAVPDDLPEAAAVSAPSPQPDSDQQPYDFSTAASVALSYAADQTVLRARRGSCATGEAAQVTVSVDGGRTLTPTDPDVVEVMAVRAVSRSELRLVGADRDCDVVRLVSDDAGRTWDDDRDDDLWASAPSDPEQVLTTTGMTRPGCVVTSLSQVGDSFGRVGCADGSVRGTGDGGAQWLELGRLDNLRVVEFTSFNAGHALAVHEGCAARSFTTRDGGRSWSAGGCITGEPAQAVAARDTGMVASVGDASYVSTDDGGSWRQP